MDFFTRYEIIKLLLSLSLILATARSLGELFRHFKLPSVIGEILAGIILGPTLLGRISPSFSQWIFPQDMRFNSAISFLTMLGILFLLLVAGLEVDLSSVWKQGKSVFWISILSIIFPLFIGITIATIKPEIFSSTSNYLALSLFIGIAISVTSLPIIAKILMDLNLLKSDFGMLLLASAMLNDLFGWLLFSIVMQLVETGSVSASNIFKTAVLTVSATVFILTVGKYIINKTLPWIQTHLSWPGGTLSYIFIVTFVFSALTEAIGIHAIFGAFLAGIAIGDSPYLKEHVREIINQFVNNIFAPLFFVSIGMKVDFISNFNIGLVLLFIFAVMFGKVGSSVVAGKVLHLKRKESLAIGSGMMASGTMGIILGLFALQYKIISNDTYVAIVTMAILTSLFSGPLIKFLMKPKKEFSFSDMLKNKLFIGTLEANNAEEAITELSAAAANEITNFSKEKITKEVLDREALMSTGLENGIAVPHARLDGLKHPYVIIGRSPQGIDFDSLDGKVANLIFMILTPLDDQESQIQILSEISNLFDKKEIREQAMKADSFIKFNSTLISK